MTPRRKSKQMQIDFRASFRPALLLAVLLGAAASDAMASGPARPASAAPADAPFAAPAPNGSAAASAPRAPVASPAPAAGDVRALIVADQEAVLSSQFAGKLVAMPKLVGDSFAAGEVLAAFDCDERRSAVKSAQAELLSARETHLAKLKLQSLGAVSDLDVTVAAAAAEKARSQLEMMQTQERYCTVRAPYAGKVVRVRAKAHESVQLGQPLLEVVSPASLRAQMFVPSAWIRWIKPGTRFSLQVEETGEAYQGRVDKISGRVDGTSQTMEVLGRFDRIPARLLPGMIGKATFDGAR